VPAELEGVAVLVVDDNYTNRRILEEVLASWSMRPTAAEDARTALSHLNLMLVAGHPSPLVLVDANMPEIDGFTLVEQIRQNPGLAAATIMMLTSTAERGDADRCRKLGVAAYLTKPIGQAELRRAIQRALGGKPEAEYRSASSARCSWGETARPLRVLLAEDNIVNQKVATRLLEKRGHRVEVAATGREALDRFRRGGFDLILMDVQMPEMDGLEATIAIRQLETGSRGHVPIIALTAHAIKKDQDRCLSAGMDGYLTKPIRAADLFREIERIGTANSPAESSHTT
jgi:two-component system sensor histidine kinase/response regulator